MKVLFVVAALLVASISASSISQQIGEKLVPKFTTGYVIKGEDAAPHSAPFIVSLGLKGEKHSHICGGTIISKEWVITAAHCIGKPEGMSIIAGLHERLNYTTHSTQRRFVDFGKNHRGFGKGVGPYDISLLHVSEPFEFNQWVQPAILPSKEHIYDGSVQLYGWGQPKAYILTASKVLKTMEVDILKYEDCKKTLDASSPLHIGNICTSSMSAGKSACNGDSGGPLVKKVNGSFAELAGIVSWGFIPCGTFNQPSIFTRVSYYIDWISEIQTAYYTLH